MRTLLLAALLAAAAFAQSDKFGAFTSAGDVGNPAMKGSTSFDAATGQYKLTGSGVNMWAKEDQFQYVYREMSGDFSVDATLEFLGEGAPHRKAGIIVRKSLETDSPYADLVIHGNGMPGVQWRTGKGDITNGFDFAFDGPGKFQLRLVRHGASLTVSFAKVGMPLRDVGVTQVLLGNPVFVGLGVCSHQPDHADTVVFSDVKLEKLVSATPAKKKQ